MKGTRTLYDWLNGMDEEPTLPQRTWQVVIDAEEYREKHEQAKWLLFECEEMLSLIERDKTYYVFKIRCSVEKINKLTTGLKTVKVIEI
jgi:hypothetical protein